MNISSLKSFAPEVRRQLIEAVTRKLDYVLTADTADLRAAKQQVEELRRQAEHDRAGLIERVAYTWFNRLAALRFLDARGWHPFRARVLTPSNAAETQPEILQQARRGVLPAELAAVTDSKRLNDLLDGHVPALNPQAEVYRQLILSTCHYYHKLMPFLFEAIDDETELLLPDDLLTEHSIAQGFRTQITDEDCSEVEVLGWLYQFYISDRKDQVMAQKSAVPSEDIPAVTQLFTPHWIVRYLVENSLGRMWLRSRPNSRLREHMPYLVLAPDGQTNESGLTVARPEDIRLLDPACGSGHMLTYAFDLLALIYAEDGYPPSEIPTRILQNNLFGLEICPRATQLAQLALVCKAREISESAFRQEINPQIVCLDNVHITADELGPYTKMFGLNSLLRGNALQQVHQFREASTLGSLIKPILEEHEISSLIASISLIDPGNDFVLRQTHEKIHRVLKQALMLCPRYHVVVANPPYMGGKTMAASLKQFAKDTYPDSWADLFAMFMDRSTVLTMPRGYSAMITMQSWMFLSTFEDFRESLLGRVAILSMAHFGSRAFDSIGGDVVSTTAFVMLNHRDNSNGVYIRLVDGENEEEKRDALLNDPTKRFYVAADTFDAIPGKPIAYWITPSMRRAFMELGPLEKIAAARIGMATGENSTYVRFWHEVAISEIGFQMASRKAAKESGAKWFPYAKGGAFRKWYGNSESVVDWSNDGHALQTTLHPAGKRIWAHNFNLEQIFRPAICWTVIAVAETGFRYHPEGYIFDAAAGLCQPKKVADNYFLLGVLNSKIAANTLKLINPTVNLHPGYLGRMPIPGDSRESVGKVVAECLAIAKRDWDNFETSWDFQTQPLLRPELKGATLEVSWGHWERLSNAAIKLMQGLETENNRILIDEFQLASELKPDADIEKITLARADVHRDIADFLSYAIGCMMGRYSLDHSGLILANAGDSLENYIKKVGKSLKKLSFAPDDDGIIPILDGEWFDDDIVARTRTFLRATFGDQSLDENLRFIEESLGKPLRKYFLTDFYKDHLQTYKKRPIYWMFSTPKKGFNALIYLHRYSRDTANKVLNRYVREYIHKLNARLKHLEHQLASEALSAREKTLFRKESEQLHKTIRECQEYERDILLPLAQKRVELDLDDGVKVNYLKLGEALAPIPGLAAAEDE